MANTDFFGKDAACLREKTLFLFDMDGTIYMENYLFPGTKPLLEHISKTGGRSVFITNNSSKSVENYVNKLLSMELDVTEDDFFTSTQATVMYLKENLPNALIYCQGTRSFITELKEAGINVTEEQDDTVEAILVGFDTELDFKKMRTTSYLLTMKKDVPYIATNPDLVCPVDFGYVPDCGSMCISYENATGRRPIYIGKPQPTMIDTVCRKLNVPKEKALVIGDRLYTDIASGRNAGVTTVCVLSGEATLDDIAGSEVKPDFVFEDVSALHKAIL